MSAAQVLVTGGAGFIGSHSVDRLLAGGTRVTVLDDFSAGRRANLPAQHPNLQVIEGDVTDATAVTQAMRGAQACLHLAAQVSVQRSLAEPAASGRINIVGLINVLEAARAHGVRRVVYASSAAIYGTPRRLPVHEDDAPAPISPYGLEKLVNERYAALYHGLYGTSTLGLRYFNVYGPRQDPSSPYSGVISKFIGRLGSGLRPTLYGDGGQTRDFVYVGDVADVNARALSANVQGVCNVGTGRVVSVRDMLATLARVMGASADADLAPAVAGDIRDSRADVQRLREALGAVPDRDLAEGLRLTLAQR